MIVNENKSLKSPDGTGKENWFLWYYGEFGTQGVQRNVHNVHAIEQNFSFTYMHRSEETQ
jgi:hypothetical protein